MYEMKKAVIYTRVSTDEQAKNNLSLKGQKDAIEDYCKHLNIEVAKHFCDAGESAKTMN
jgi:site-specific DNA recombinase